MAHDADQYSASYKAFFAPRSHQFETVDFRVPTSLVNLNTYFATTDASRTRQERTAGLLTIIVGLSFAIIGFGVDQLTRGLTLAVYRATNALFQAQKFWPAVLVFSSISLLYVLIAALMVIYIAPLGAGSGIPELKSYLNGVRVPGFLASNSLLVKAVGVAFSIASGLICGKQGPMIHAGAIVGAGLSQGASTRFSYRVDSSLFRFLRTEAWKRDFTAVGAGVGVAVAFGSPMGAWMWVFEEACTHWTWRIGILTLGGCLSGAIVVRILNYCAAGLPGNGFGAFTLTQFGKLVTVFEGSSFPLKDIPAFLLLGVIGGISGALLPLLNKYITLFRYTRVKKPVRRLVETALIGLMTSLIRIIVPYLADDCQDIDADMEEVLKNAPMQDFSSFTCPPSQFSPWAALTYNPSDTVVRSLLYTPGTVFPPGAVAFTFVFYFLFIVWTYGSAVPAGVFFPGFLLGSVYGRLVGIAVKRIFQSRTDVSLSGYAFLGSVSALAGFTRTISVAVIALEATGMNNASFGAAFVAIVAKLVGDFIYSRGIYDLHIDLKGMPFLPSQVPHLEKYYNVRVSDVMSTNVIGVRRLSRIGGLLSTLAAYDHNVLPVFVKLRSKKSRQVDSDLALIAPDEDSDGGTDVGSLSTSSRLEAEESSKQDSTPSTLSQLSSIITPSHLGLQATIFDDGDIRLVNIAGPEEASRSQVTHQSTDRRQSVDDSTKSQGQKKHDRSNGIAKPGPVEDFETMDSEHIERVHFELVGSIDRGTLLALLKHECDKHIRREQGEEVNESEAVPREDLDSAWPNRARLKGDWEKQLVERIKAVKMDAKIVDLKSYIDPDPLLMSDRAFSIAAYQMFRRTGSRHIFVVNARVGQVVGIVTRKDILPESVTEIYNRYRDVKVE